MPINLEKRSIDSELGSSGDLISFSTISLPRTSGEKSNYHGVYLDSGAKAPTMAFKSFRTSAGFQSFPR